MTNKASAESPEASMQPFQRQLQHLLELAKKPEWRPQVCWRVLELEADTSGLWAGLKDAVLAQEPGLEKTTASVAREMAKRR